MRRQRIGWHGVHAAVATLSVLPVLALPGSEPVSGTVTAATSDGPVITSPRASASFTIRGAVAVPLVIGASVPIVLTISNPNLHPITIQSFSIEVDAVNAASPGAQCGASDFAVQQLSRGAHLVVPAARRMDFVRLGLSAEQLPRLTMINRAQVNQDGCKGATVALVARGSAVGGQQ